MMEEVKLGRSLGVLAGVMAGAPAVRCDGGGRLDLLEEKKREKENEVKRKEKEKEIEKGKE